MIPKPAQYNSIVSNYRAISLLNVDAKIYAKMPASRLLPLLPKLVSLDQVGLIPGREARDNMLKAISIAHWLSSQTWLLPVTQCGEGVQEGGLGLHDRSPQDEHAQP